MIFLISVKNLNTVIFFNGFRPPLCIYVSYSIIIDYINLDWVSAHNLTYIKFNVM